MHPVNILSMFIYDKLGVFAALIIGDDKKEVHAGCNTETPVTSEFTFKLIGKILCIIFEKLDHIAVRKAVLKIYEAAGKRIETLYLRHSFDMKVVEFFYQLLFERFKFG